MIKAKLFSLSGFLALLLLAGMAVQTAALSSLDSKLLDAGFKINRAWFPQDVKNDVVVVGIDDEFIDSVDEPLALNHVYLGEFLSTVAAVSPKVIGLDIAFPEKRFDTITSTRNPDMDYHKALLLGLLQATQTTKVVVAKVWDERNSRYQNINVDYASVLANQDDSFQAAASAIFLPDADGTIRKYPGPSVQPDHTDRIFSSEIAAAAGIRQQWDGLIDFQSGQPFHIPGQNVDVPGQPFNVVRIQDVLKWGKEGNAEELQRRFAGKVVLLGAVLRDADRLQLPVQLAAWEPKANLVFGVLAQAQMVRNMLNNGFLQPARSWVVWTLCAFFALFWFGERLLLKAVLFISLGAGLLALSDVLLLKGHWLPPFAILTTGLLAIGASSGLQAWHNFRDKQHLLRTFSGSVSPQVMKEIIAGGLGADRKGMKVPVCVMFSDIRGFTTMSEKLPAEEVVSLLNRYFARMTAAVHRHGGTVDKFIGDGMMAFFGAPNPIEHPEESALAAAREMMAALEELNAEFVAEGRSTISIGVGLHTGEVVIGYVGSPERHEYTAIGDTVNIAARLEGLCKDVGAPIVCSAAVAQATGFPPQLVDCGERALKGRSSMVVYGWKTEAHRLAAPQEMAA